MSSLKDKLTADLTAAMKSGDKLTVSVIRMAKSSIKYSEIDKKKELDEEGVTEVLLKEVKMRRDTIPEYEKAGRADDVAALNNEIAILQKYLPEQLDDEQLAAIVKEVISEIGPVTKQDMGKVMKSLMPRVKGKADGKRVNAILSGLLE